MGFKNFLTEWGEVTLKTITSPLNPPVQHESSRLRHGIFSLSVLSVLSGLFYGSFMAYSTISSGSEMPAMFGSSETMAVLAASGAFMSASLVVIFFAALVGLTGLTLTHLLLSWSIEDRFSENYQKTLEPISISMAPLAIFGWIPLLNVFSIDYWLLISISGFKKGYPIGKLKAVIAASPLIFWGILIVTLMLQSQKIMAGII